MDRNATTYNLYSTERRYREETLVSYHFQKNKQIIKQFSPVDINGERLRMDLKTGEITEYTKRQILNSYNASLRRTNICMTMLLNMNDFDWFCTLTFDKEKIDRTNAREVFDCYEKYVNNLKHKFPTLKYMTFPERHDDGYFHFHLLIGGVKPKELGLVNSGKVCCSWATKKNGICSKEYFEKTKHLHELKDTDGETIYNITSFVHGFTTASRIVSRERCNSYVKKYVEKALGSTDVFKKRFYYSSNLNVPDIVKRLVGADFDTPIEIDKVEQIKNSPLYKFAKTEPYINDYNVLQIKVDNELIDSINKGATPLLEHEINEIINTKLYKDDIDLEDIF